MECRLKRKLAEKFQEIDGPVVICSRSWLAKVGIYRWRRKSEDAWESVGLLDTPCEGVIIFAQSRPWKSILVTSRQTGSVDSPSKSPSSFRSPDLLLPLLARIRNEIKILQETETSRSSSSVSSHPSFRGREHRVRSPPGIRKIKETRDRVCFVGSRRSFDSDELGAADGSATFHGKERIPKSWANLKLGIKGLILS